MVAAARLVATWVVLAGILLGVGWLLTGPLAGSLGVWDDEVARAIADQRTATASTVADVPTLLGDTPVGVAVGALGAAALSLWRRSWLPALVEVVVLAGSGALYEVGTRLITRDRPPVKILDPGLVPDHSYPSGHVFTSVAAYAGLAVLVWWLAPRSRPWVGLLALVPVVVLLARLYQGAHHVTDVVTSLLLGTAWLAAVSLTLLRGRERP